MKLHLLVARDVAVRVWPRHASRRDRGVWGCALASLWVLFAPVSGLAEACANFPGPCQRQVQAPVTYTGWQTQGWAYYCTGDHFYYIGPKDGHVGNFSFDNSCFSVIETVGAEDDVDKFDALITNWCLNSQAITITIGCITGSDPY